MGSFPFIKKLNSFSNKLKNFSPFIDSKKDYLLVVSSFLIIFTIFQCIFFKFLIPANPVFAGFYALIILFRFIAYWSLFKKFTFTKIEFYRKSLIPIILLLLELPLLLMQNINNSIFSNFFSLNNLSLEKLPEIIFIALFFIVSNFFIVPKYHFYSKVSPFKKTAYYIVLIGETFIFAFIYGLIFTSSKSLAFIIREVLIFFLLSYQIYFYINQTNEISKKSSLLKSRNPTVGKYYRIRGKVIRDVYHKEVHHYFTFSHDEVTRFIMISSHGNNQLIYLQKHDHFIGLKYYQDLLLGDNVTILGILLSKQIIGEKKLDYLLAISIKIDSESDFRSLT